mmetsp:Transcript_30165/g.93084  ORF Transcript_30165/g.93084 Transcript_30165/m.93084 type:complete len:282 (+) Transcript_30165:29-874(+)
MLLIRWFQGCSSATSGLLVVAVPRALDGLTTTDTASAAGGDQTDLLARGAVAADGRRVTNVLVVTTTVGVLHGVTGHTTHLGPAVALGAEAVVRVTGLEDRLLDTATASDDADHGTARRRHGLLVARGQLQARAAGVGVVRDDDAVVTRGASEGRAVTSLGLDVAHDAALRDLAERQDVADGHTGLVAAVDGLAGEHALGGDEELLHALVLVRVAELDAGERGAAPGVVLDVTDDAAHEAVALGVVEAAELGRAQTAVAVDGVHGGRTLTLRQDNLAHGNQ